MSISKADQADLTALTELAGIRTPPGFVRIVTELLALGVSPEDIYGMLCKSGPEQASRDQGIGSRNT